MPPLSRDLSFDLSTGFEHECEPREQELEVELELERDRERDNSREEISDEAHLEEGELIPPELTLEDENELETELSLEVDYARTWGEGGEIELGYDGERTRGDYRRLIHMLQDPSAALDEPIDRGHEERETSHSLYTTLTTS